jgi:hypothetical protein
VAAIMATQRGYLLARWQRFDLVPPALVEFLDECTKLVTGNTDRSTDRLPIIVNPDEPAENYLRTAQVGELLRIGPQRVRQLVEAKAFPNALQPGGANSCWLIRQSDVDDLLRRKSAAPAA